MRRAETPGQRSVHRVTRCIHRVASLAPLGLLAILVGFGCSGGSEPRTGARAGGTTATLPAATAAASAPSEPALTPTPVRPPSGRDAERGSGRDSGRNDGRNSGDEDKQDPTVIEVPPPTAPGQASADRLAERAAQDDTLTVIDGSQSPRNLSLGEVARRAREKRGTAAESKIVITNDNLSEYATGKLTVAAPKMPSPETAAASGSEGARAARNEDDWRRETRELRLKLRRAWDEAQALEEQVAGLRLRFYAEDDPYVRDSEIKPAWDRALDRQRQAELEAKAYRRELDELLEEGRRAGALPGWLREGIEYEPDVELEPKAQGDGSDGSPEGFGRHEPVEPERMENPSRPPSR